jgi:uncharacterized protein
MRGAAMTLIIEIKVVASAGCSKIILDKAGTIKCYVKAAPEQGKANKEVIKLFADFFTIPQYAITLISGLTTTRKRLKIDTFLTLKEVKHKISSQEQITNF